MAQSVIGALRVNLGLDSAQFQRGARVAETRAQQLGKAFARLGIAAAAAGGALVALARRQANVVDAQAKLAQSLGTSVVSIQTLQRAGELAGVSMSGIEQATKDLTRRLSQAAAGIGPAADALDRLGLSAEELLSLPLDERVGKINAAIDQFVPAAERAAVAGQLFGEEGSIAISRIDGATLRQATEDIRDFGVAVSEQDAEQIERTNDALSALGLITQGIGNQIAVALAPALERMATGLRNATKEGTLFADVIKVLAGNADVLIKALGVLAGLLAVRLTIAAGSAAVALAALFGPVGVAVGVVAALGAGVAVLVDRLGIFKTSAEATDDPVIALNEALRDFAETKAPAAAARAIDVANANYQLAASAVDAARAEIAKGRALIAAGQEGSGRSARGQQLGGERLVRQGEAALAAAEAELADALDNRTRAITAVTSTTEFNTEVTAAAAAVTDAATEATDGLAAATGGAAAAAQQLAPEIKDVGDELEQLAVTGEDVRKGLASVFTDAIRGASSLSEGLSRLAGQFADRLLNQGFEQLLGAVSGGGGGGGIFASIGKIFGFATGTPSAPGGLAMVGERGPELVNLPRGSEVLDAQRTRNMFAAPQQMPSVQVAGATIINVLDPRLVGDFLNTPQGEKAVINVIQRNREAL